MTQKRKLFLSFTRTLYLLAAKKITEDDLAEGLYLFGCTRDHAITPGGNGEKVEKIVVDRPDLHLLLVDALLKAEQDNRVSWRTREGWVTFPMVDALLVQNEFKPLFDQDGGCLPSPQYFAPKFVKERSRELEVIEQ